MPPATAEDVGKSVIVGEDGKYELAEAGNPLPVPVLPEDVGKAIIVDENGGYALAEAGDNELFVVNITRTDNGVGSCDKTYDEIKAAIIAKQNIQFNLTFYENVFISHNCRLFPGMQAIYVLFVSGLTYGPANTVDLVVAKILAGGNAELKNVHAEATLENL